MKESFVISEVEEVAAPLTPMEQGVIVGTGASIDIGLACWLLAIILT